MRSSYEEGTPIDHTAYDAALAYLEFCANRLWKPKEPDRFDFVFGRIWLHFEEIRQRMTTQSPADILAGLKFHSGDAQPIWNYYVRSHERINGHIRGSPKGDSCNLHGFESTHFGLHSGKTYPFASPLTLKDENMEWFEHPTVVDLVIQQVEHMSEENVLFDISQNPLFKMDSIGSKETPCQWHKIESAYWDAIKTIGHRCKSPTFVVYNNPFDPRIYFHGIVPLNFPKDCMYFKCTPTLDQNLFLTVRDISDLLEHHTSKYRLYLLALGRPPDAKISQDTNIHSKSSYEHSAGQSEIMAIVRVPLDEAMDKDTIQLFNTILSDTIKVLWICPEEEVPTKEKENKLRRTIKKPSLSWQARHGKKSIEIPEFINIPGYQRQAKIKDQTLADDEEDPTVKEEEKEEDSQEMDNSQGDSILEVPTEMWLAGSSPTIVQFQAQKNRAPGQPIITSTPMNSPPEGDTDPQETETAAPCEEAAPESASNEETNRSVKRRLWDPDRNADKKNARTKVDDVDKEWSSWNDNKNNKDANHQLDPNNDLPSKWKVEQKLSDSASTTPSKSDEQDESLVVNNGKALPNQIANADFLSQPPPDLPNFPEQQNGNAKESFPEEPAQQGFTSQNNAHGTGQNFEGNHPKQSSSIGNMMGNIHNNHIHWAGPYHCPMPRSMANNPMWNHPLQPNIPNQPLQRNPMNQKHMLGMLPHPPPHQGIQNNVQQQQSGNSQSQSQNQMPMMMKNYTQFNGQQHPQQPPLCRTQVPPPMPNPQQYQRSLPINQNHPNFPCTSQPSIHGNQTGNPHFHNNSFVNANCFINQQQNNMNGNTFKPTFPPGGNFYNQNNTINPSNFNSNGSNRQLFQQQPRFIGKQFQPQQNFFAPSNRVIPHSEANSTAAARQGRNNLIHIPLQQQNGNRNQNGNHGGPVQGKPPAQEKGTGLNDSFLENNYEKLNLLGATCLRATNFRLNIPKSSRSSASVSSSSTSQGSGGEGGDNFVAYDMARPCTNLNPNQPFCPPGIKADQQKEPLHANANNNHMWMQMNNCPPVTTEQAYYFPPPPPDSVPGTQGNFEQQAAQITSHIQQQSKQKLEGINHSNNTLPSSPAGIHTVKTSRGFVRRFLPNS